MELVAFDDLLAAVQATDKDGLYKAKLTEDWLQGRAGFGGLMAALAVQALRAELGNERPLRALMTSFIGPPAAGEVDIHTAALRSGKSVTWAEARIMQAGQACTAFSAAFGGNRDSAIKVQPATRPETKSPEDSTVFPFIPNVTPNFTQHFEMRWAIGGMPMSNSGQSEMGAWIRFRNPANFGEAHVVSLMDLLPPAVLQMQAEMKPISSLTWHLEMLDDLSAPDAQDGEGWWFFHVHARGAANGYSQQSATLFTPAGRALAMSQQTIAVFA
ncbi:MAG: acyl-CoA thioesterase [Nevskiales bacterium]